jgi:hypothetical protein
VVRGEAIMMADRRERSRRLGLGLFVGQNRLGRRSISLERGETSRIYACHCSGAKVAPALTTFEIKASRGKGNEERQTCKRKAKKVIILGGGVTTEDGLNAWLESRRADESLCPVPRVLDGPQKENSNVKRPGQEPCEICKDELC